MKKTIITLAVFVALTVYAHGQTPMPAATNTETIVKTTGGHAIGMAGLPKDAQKFIKENFSTRGVRYVTKARSDAGQIVYEAGVNLEGRIDILQFDANGELLSEKVRK